MAIEDLISARDYEKYRVNGEISNPQMKERITVAVTTDNQRTAFGAQDTAQDTPIVNIDFSYNLHPDFVETRLNGGSASVDANRMKLSTGAGANQSSQLLSVTPVKYHSGIGAKVRFTALFTTGLANSTQIMGVGDAGDGYFFGYDGATFGVLRRHGGAPEIRSITVTTASTTNEDITITLDSDAATDVTVTNSSDVTVTANEIAAHDYSNVGRGWAAIAYGATVKFVSYSAGERSGTYSLSGASTAIGSSASILTGVSATDSWIAQTSWNKDKFDGSGATGVTLDPTKGNVYQIQYQWLGFGQIRFFIEHPTDGDLELVHTIDYANENTLPSINNPTLPLCALVANTSNTSDLVLYSSSMSGFAEGEIPQPLVRHTRILDKTFSSADQAPAITLHSEEIFQGKLNRVRVKLVSVSVAVESGKPALIEVIVGNTLVGASFSAFKANASVISIDVSATSTTGGEILEAFTVPTGEERTRIINRYIEPHHHITISGAEATAGADPVTKIIVVFEEDF